MHIATDAGCPGRGKKNGQACKYVCKSDRRVVGKRTVRQTDRWMGRQTV